MKTESVGVVIMGSRGDVMPLLNFVKLYLREYDIIIYASNDLQKYVEDYEFVGLDFNSGELYAQVEILDIAIVDKFT